MVDGRHHLLQGDMAEQIWHGLAVVSSTDGLCKDHGDVNNLEAERDIEGYFIEWFIYWENIINICKTYQLPKILAFPN